VAGWDTSELDQLIDDLDRAGPKAVELTQLVVEKTGFDTVSGAQERVPVDTGHLKNTIGVDFDADLLGFEAGPTASYGAHVEYGTKPHVIRPRNARALHWVTPEGDEVFVTRVHHPGTAPQPYMRPAFEQAVEPLPKLLDQVVKRSLW